MGAEWELPETPVTIGWLGLSCGRGICAAEHRPEGHAAFAAQHSTAQAGVHSG